MFTLPFMLLSHTIRKMQNMKSKMIDTKQTYFRRFHAVTMVVCGVLVREYENTKNCHTASSKIANYTVVQTLLTSFLVLFIDKNNSVSFKRFFRSLLQVIVAVK